MAENSRHRTLNFSVGFDSTADSELPIMAYLFTRSGRLLASAPVSKGETILKGETLGHEDLRLFIAPSPQPVGEGEQEVSLAVMERLRAYEPTCAATTAPRIGPGSELVGAAEQAEGVKEYLVII